MSCGRTGCHCGRGHDASHANAARKAEEARHSSSECDASKPSVSNQAMGQALSGGTALDPNVRSEMEARFGQSFADVRVHDDPSAHGLAQWHLAQAFTVGNHVTFNAGRYQPTTGDGKRLLAHELAHVVQQRRGGAAPASQSDALEGAADSAASSYAAGSGSVQVAGASGVGVARQPLPQEDVPEIPPPKSLTQSLRKDEDALPDHALQREVDLIEYWLVNYPKSADRANLIVELDALHAEKMARRKRREEQAPKAKPKEGTAASLLNIVHEGRLEQEEVQEANRMWLATGKIPQTSTPFSWAEIKTGTRMNRAQRYDLMTRLQGKDMQLIGDIYANHFDPEFLNPFEYVQEFWTRYNKDIDWCDDEYTRPGPTYRCEQDVNAKYGGPGYREWKEEEYLKAYQRYLHYTEQLESMQSGGIVSLAGRVGGYAAGALSGNDALAWSEKGADLFSIGDVAFAGYAGYKGRSQMQSYQGSAGLEVHRDSPITELFDPKSTGLLEPSKAPTPIESEPVKPPSTPAPKGLDVEGRLSALEVPAGKRDAFSKAAAQVRALAAKDQAAAERMLEGLEDRFLPADRKAQLAQNIAEQTGRFFPEKGAKNIYRQEQAADARKALEQRTPTGKDVLKANIRESERLGTMGGKEQAEKEGIKVRDWNTPQQWKGEFGKGPDSLGDRGDKRLILENKGGGTHRLGVSNNVVEMSNEWAGRKIAELEAVGDTATAADLLQAARDGRLQGAVYWTRELQGGLTTTRVRSYQLRDQLTNENISESGLIQYSYTKVERAYRARLTELQQAIQEGDMRRLKNL
jgi:hypothetical protein